MAVRQIGGHNPWQTHRTAVEQMRSQHRPVDYKAILGSNRVLFLAESSNDERIREHIVAFAGELRSAGITHYAIEAPETSKAAIGRLNRGEDVDLSEVELGLIPSNYEFAVRAVASQGIEVVAISPPLRMESPIDHIEAQLTKNLFAILQDPNARIAVLIGGMHATSPTIYGKSASVNKRLLDNGVSTTAVTFIGGKFGDPTILVRAVDEAGLAKTTFMLDLRNKSPFHEDYVYADYAVYLPKSRLVLLK